MKPTDQIELGTTVTFRSAGRRNFLTGKILAARVMTSGIIYTIRVGDLVIKVSADDIVGIET